MKRLVAVVASLVVGVSGVLVAPAAHAAEWETVFVRDEVIQNEKISEYTHVCKNPPCTTPQPANKRESRGSLPPPRERPIYQELHKGVKDGFDLWSVSPNSGEPAIYGQERVTDWVEVETPFGRKPSRVGVTFTFRQEPRWECRIAGQYPVCDQVWGPWEFTGRKYEDVNPNSYIRAEATNKYGAGRVFAASSYQARNRYYWPQTRYPVTYHPDQRPYVAPDDYEYDSRVERTRWANLDPGLNSVSMYFAECYSKPRFTCPLPPSLATFTGPDGQQMFGTGRNDTNPGRYEALSLQQGKWLIVLRVAENAKGRRTNLTPGLHVVLDRNLITGDTTVNARSGIAPDLSHAPVVPYTLYNYTAIRCGVETMRSDQPSPVWPDGGRDSYYYATQCPPPDTSTVGTPPPGNNPLDGGTPLPPVADRSELTGGPLAGWCANANRFPLLTRPGGTTEGMTSQGVALAADGRISRLDYRGTDVDRWIDGKGWASQTALPGTLSYATRWNLGGINPTYPSSDMSRPSPNTVSPSYRRSFTGGVADIAEINNAGQQPYTSIRWDSISDYESRQSSRNTAITDAYRQSVWQDLNRYTWTGAFDRGLGVRFVEPSSSGRDHSGAEFHNRFVLQPEFLLRGAWRTETLVIAGYVNEGVGFFQPKPVYETRNRVVTETFRCQGAPASMRLSGIANTTR